MPNALFKRFNGTQWEEFKFLAYDSEKLGGVLPSGYALASHPHIIADITDLQTELNGKLSSAAGSVTNTNLANMAVSTVKGRALNSGTGAPVDLTRTQLTALVEAATTNTAGKVTLSQSTTLQNDTDAVITEDILQGLMGTANTQIAFGNHGHGNISSAGGWNNTPQTVASGNTFVITKNGLLNNSSLAFGTATDTFLRNDGTWAEAGGGGSFGYSETVSTAIDLSTTTAERVFQTPILEAGTYRFTIQGGMARIGSSFSRQLQWWFRTFNANYAIRALVIYHGSGQNSGNNGGAFSASETLRHSLINSSSTSTTSLLFGTGFQTLLQATALTDMSVSVEGIVQVFDSLQRFETYFRTTSANGSNTGRVNVGTRFTITKID